MLDINDFNLRKINEQDLETLLRWRNSDRVRTNMYTDHIISMKEHRAWFNRIKDESTALYLIFEHLEHPIGFVYFTQIDITISNCMWGFYLGERNVPNKSGTIMGYMSLNHIFDVNKLQRVNGEVLAFNKPSQKFFQRLGFSEVGRLKNHAMKNDKLTDVVQFSITADEWRRIGRTSVENLFRDTVRR
ncbi:MAG: UDP-4-amino-4,6-dideoxy-N-acetyl-beta-L-altrosamine N-acetyltransferase [candidate division Zixibacteria bacterium]|nr:UDP-4-amino-4,6-dideoxy-N-acetyl-beta-L-altrosamine N-acetyltransferase [candidate division Zixibacteria bacterium]